MNSGRPLVTVKDCAHLVGASVRTVRRWISDGQLVVEGGKVDVDEAYTLTERKRRTRLANLRHVA